MTVRLTPTRHLGGRYVVSRPREEQIAGVPCHGFLVFLGPPPPVQPAGGSLPLSLTEDDPASCPYMQIYGPACHPCPSQRYNGIPCTPIARIGSAGKEKVPNYGTTLCWCRVQSSWGRVQGLRPVEFSSAVGSRGGEGTRWRERVVPCLRSTTVFLPSLRAPGVRQAPGGLLTLFLRD